LKNEKEWQKSLHWRKRMPEKWGDQLVDAGSSFNDVVAEGIAEQINSIRHG
jgi:hypothetical protein